MKEAVFENLYAGMLEQLERINGSVRESAINLEESLRCMATTIRELRQQVRQHPFGSEKDEIHFFKHTKPRFSAWQIYILELHQVLSAVPIDTEERIRDYYREELRVRDRFFRLHAFHYQYYLASEQCKDEAFFLRRNRSAFPPGQELLATDPDFSTNLDHLFGMFRAYEMLRDFLIKRIRILYQEPNHTFVKEIMDSRKRRWSGSKTELVEFAYGIYFSRRVNGGKADISDIIGWLEESFNEDLAQAYRMFVDITRRKTISHTQYLDEMRGAIHRHIEESLQYKPKKSIPKNGMTTEK